MIKAIAVDDEPPALRIIENFCGRIDTLKLEKTFTAPAEALKYLRKFPVDLLFLDIKMQSMSGIELMKALSQKTMVIFTTGHSEYAVESYNLNAIDYLLKPFPFERFEKAVIKAMGFYKQQTPTDGPEAQHFFIRADYSLVKVRFADILFIEGLDDYLKIHLVNQKPLVARMTLKAILEKLPQSDFIRVHRSFIVPLSRIESIKNRIINLAGEEIPIGSSYEEAFNKRFLM
jgi:DNA-binding LytR/AlgR family response regulator